MFLSIIIFSVAYVCIATEKIDKTIAVITGAFLMLCLNLIPFDKAVASIDLNVIFLLIGMMTCVFVLSKTGFFELIAVSVAKHSKGSPIRIMLLFLTATCVLSAFLDNVTTIILISPVTILVAEILEISPVPFLILEAISSNIGGTSTLIGDPPNILIGSQANLTFNDFIINLSPVIAVVFLIFLVTIYLLFRKKWNIAEQTKRRVTEAIPHLAIIDKKNMIRALIVLGFIFLGFVTDGITHLKPGIVALTGSMFMILICRTGIDQTLMKVEWGAIFFFIGLFMLVSGLEHNGVIKLLAGGIIKTAGPNILLLCLVILISSAFISSILGSIPFAITMIPIVKELIIYLSQYSTITNTALIHTQIAQPLWWSLALGASLGGNGTLIGAAANVVAAKIGERNHHTITFFRFFKYGFPLMIQSIIICAIYIWLRYF